MISLDEAKKAWRKNNPGLSESIDLPVSNTKKPLIVTAQAHLSGFLHGLHFSGVLERASGAQLRKLLEREVVE